MTRHRLAAVAAFVIAAMTGLIAATAPTPADQCRAAGYADALHILQPDGKSREWLCYSLPSEDLRVPWRAKYLKEIP